MSSVNKAILIGNLGSDPELRHTQAGKAVCNLSLATNERWSDANGQTQERTEWHRIVVWGKTAENCEKYLVKGRRVYVEGRIQTSEWTDDNGTTRKSTEVVAQQVVFLGGDSAAPARGRQQRRQPSGPPANTESGFDQHFNDDDIPF